MPHLLARTDSVIQPREPGADYREAARQAAAAARAALSPHKTQGQRTVEEASVATSIS